MGKIISIVDRTPATFWDTVEFEPGKEHVNAFSHVSAPSSTDTNLQHPGVLALNGIFRGTRVLFAAPVDTLRAWQNVRWDMMIGCQPYFSQPLWMKPDAVVDPKDLVVAGWDFSETLSPLDWTYLEWRFDFVVPPRWAFYVQLSHDGAAKPAGKIRVAVRGKVERELL
jgi:hypothetical protein